jgi:hypothetical protein
MACGVKQVGTAALDEDDAAPLTSSAGMHAPSRITVHKMQDY